MRTHKRLLQNQLLLSSKSMTWNRWSKKLCFLPSPPSSGAISVQICNFLNHILPENELRICAEYKCQCLPFSEWSALIQHFTEPAIVLRRKAKNEQSKFVLIPLFPPGGPSFRSKSVILPSQVNHKRRPKKVTKQNAGLFFNKRSKRNRRRMSGTKLKSLRKLRRWGEIN